MFKINRCQSRNLVQNFLIKPKLIIDLGYLIVGSKRALQAMKSPIGHWPREYQKSPSNN